MEGASIGPYRIVRKLGEGGMGAVWLGEHALLGRRAAIKVLLREFSSNEEIVQRFFNEAKAVTAIADPGIVQVFDFGYHTDGSAFLVMEVLEGEAMDARLKRIGRFAAIDAVRLMAQIATSLGAAHAKGVIHRDLKPENIFIVGDPAVTGGERTKILDFGIAKLAGDEPGKLKTRTGIVMGTPVYMSPEQCRGMSNIDSRSDVYTLGCVLFTMLTGRPPFEAEGTGDLIIMHVRDQPPPPSQFAPGLTAELDAVVLQCLEKNPSERFQSTAALVQALGAVEPALYGLDPGHSMSSHAYRRASTPAAALAYRQQPTPMQSAPLPTSPPMQTTPPQQTASKVTTLEAASATVHPTQAPPRRRTGLIIGVVAAVGIAATAIAVVAGGGSSTETTGSDRASPATQPPPPTPDAGVAATPATPDAAVVAAPPVDAAVAATVAPVDASVPVTIDAGVVAKKRDPKIPKRVDTGPKRGSNGSSTGSGGFDRGD